MIDSSTPEFEVLDTNLQWVEISGMWLRPDAVWAVRPGYATEGDCCVVTGPNGAEFRLPGITAAEVARRLSGVEVPA